MSKRKRKKHEEEHMDETWLVPYSDILTLLLALFVILFAMSSVDAQKFNVLSRAFNQMFTGGTGIMNFSSTVPTGPTDMKNDAKVEMQQNQAQKTNSELDKQIEANAEAYKKDQQELYAIQTKVNTYIQNNSLTDKLQTSLTSEGLLVTIRDNVLFDSGSADVRPQDIQMAQEISALLVMDPPRSIIISGHTDNVPIKNSKYASNWELSVMRAVNFMKVILQNGSLDPKWFSAKGFGEYQPVASNDTPEGKSKNRRVEILISPRVEKQQ
jgi:chemotaxis protein MotB